MKGCVAREVGGASSLPVPGASCPKFLEGRGDRTPTRGWKPPEPAGGDACPTALGIRGETIGSSFAAETDVWPGRPQEMRPFGGGLPVPLFRRGRRSRSGRGVAFLLDFPSPHPSPARSSQGEGDRRPAFQCLIQWQVLRTGPTNGSYGRSQFGGARLAPSRGGPQSLRFRCRREAAQGF